MRKLKELEKASIIAILSKSGGGKTYLGDKITSKDKRLVFWDSMMDAKEKDYKIITKARLLADEMMNGNFRIAFQPTFENLHDDFALFCNLAFEIGDMRVKVDELGRVTKASYAPPPWQNVTCRSRHRRLRVVGMAQRPSMVDKDFIANATVGYAGRLPYEDDQKALRSVLGKRAYGLSNIKMKTFIKWTD